MKLNAEQSAMQEIFLSTDNEINERIKLLSDYSCDEKENSFKYYLLAQLFMAEKNFISAFECVKKALSYDSIYISELNFLVIQIYIYSKDYRELKKFSQLQINADKQWFGGHFGLGYYFYIMGNYKTAEEHLIRANNLEFNILTGSILVVVNYHLEEYERAIECMKYCIEFQPTIIVENSSATFATCYALISLNHKEEAEELLNQYIEMSGDLINLEGVNNVKALIAESN